MATTQLSSVLRPKRLQDVRGQPGAVAYVRGMMRDGSTPNLVLITGPFGTGKTTLGRIVASLLTRWRGDPDRDPDVREVAANVDKTIDDVRELLSFIKYLPRGGHRRVIVVDEAHSYAGPAASAMLKATEDPPAHVTWVWCTSEPAKIQASLKQRAQSIVLHALSPEDLSLVVEDALASQQTRFRDPAHAAVVRDISRAAGGSARLAVQMVETLVRTLHGGGSVRDALSHALESTTAVDGMEAAVEFLQAVLEGNAERAVKALGSSTGDGVLELAAGLLSGLIRRRVGCQPKDGLGWLSKRVTTRASLAELLALEHRVVGALVARASSNYVVPADAVLFALAASAAAPREERR